MGEVGRRLASALKVHGLTVVPVTRSEGWDRAASSEPGLRVVCVREQVLEDALARLDGARVSDDEIVLIQNGWIRPLVRERPQVTRGLIWFTAKGSFFKVLRPSPFCGPAADAMASALSATEIGSEAVDAARFAALDADKMGFNCVVGLPLAVHQLSLGEYLDQRRDEAEALFTESVQVCAAAAGVEADRSWWPELVETVQPLHWVTASSAKALEYRNGAVLRLARRLGSDVPVTAKLLAAVGWEG
jgi:ketopantoate reductase